jgi:prepilin-type N-terminal cleavage/methylation domain-containing protein
MPCDMNQRGFSLIELIVVLALMGIVGLMAGFGISQLVDGFVYTKGVADNTGKGQLAMLRLSDEMRRIKAVTSGNDNSINFVVVDVNEGSKIYTVSWGGSVGDDLLLNNDILIGNIKSFALKYYSTYDDVDDGSPNWVSASSNWVSAYKIIEISLKLTNPNQIDSIFKTRITPRNI